MPSSFQYSLFECCEDKDTCLITSFVPCYTLGINAKLVGGNCLLYALTTFTCFYGIAGGKVRRAIRERYDIQGKNHHDYILHCFCPCCSLVQDMREIKAHGETPNQQFMARQ